MLSLNILFLDKKKTKKRQKLVLPYKEKAFA